jgi:glutamyl-tRNA reductase
LKSEIAKADIILVATNCTEPIVLKEHLQGLSEKVIIDLSIPYNVETAAHELVNVHIVNVDELSKLKDETLKMRMAEVPKAKAIISESLEEFQDWYHMRRHVPMLKDLKVKLKELYLDIQNVHASATSESEAIDLQIQRLLNQTAQKLKVQNEKGCQYLQALNQIMSSKN